MTAAYPLPLPLPGAEELDIFPMDDAYMASLPEEVRDAILAAEARIEGGSATLVPHAQAIRDLEQQQRDHG